MKNIIQIKIINLLNKLFKKNKINEIYNNYEKELLFDGLLEWDEESNKFINIDVIKNINLESLLFIDTQKKALINNTRYFLEGGQANNALLWGSRGTGKSSLVLALYNFLKDKYIFSMIEIKFFQIKHLPKILSEMEGLLIFGYRRLGYIPDKICSKTNFLTSRFPTKCIGIYPNN